MNRDRADIAAMVVCVLIAVVVGGIAIYKVGPEYREWREQSAEWCADQGGEFEETVAGGRYSGLECALESGKTVDMGEVAERGYPDETSQIPSLHNTPYNPWPWGGLGLKELGALFAVTFGIVLSSTAYQRYRGVHTTGE